MARKEERDSRFYRDDIQFAASWAFLGVLGIVSKYGRGMCQKPKVIIA